MSRDSKKVSASSGMPRALQKSTKSRVAPSRHQGISSGSTMKGPSQIAIRSTRNGSIRVTGSEYLGAVQKSSSEAPDYLYVSRPNVAGPTNTRLNQFASIYERWRPLKYRYRFTSSLPTSCTGTFCMATEPDPIIPYAQGETGNVARLRALPGSKMFQAWESAFADIPSSRDYTSLWCEDPDASVEGADRLDQAGTFYLSCAATTSVAAGTTLGMLELEYEIEFYVPRLNAAAITHAAEYGFDSSFWTTILASATSVPIFNKLLLFFKEYGKPVSSVLASVLRLYETINATEDSKAVRVVSTGLVSDTFTGGFAAGVHDMTLTLCYVNLPGSTSSPTGGGYSSSNVVYAESYSDSVPWDQVNNYHANNGEIYLRGFQLHVTYAVSGAMRGYVDWTGITSAFSAPDYVEFKYKQAGGDFVNTISGDTMSSKRVPKSILHRKKLTARPGETKVAGEERKVEVRSDVSGPVIFHEDPAGRLEPGVLVRSPTSSHISSSSSSGSSLTPVYRRS